MLVLVLHGLTSQEITQTLEPVVIVVVLVVVLQVTVEVAVTVAVVQDFLEMEVVLQDPMVNEQDLGLVDVEVDMVQTVGDLLNGAVSVAVEVKDLLAVAVAVTLAVAVDNGHLN